jgi:hypothetical protein
MVRFCIIWPRLAAVMQLRTHTVHNCTRGPTGARMMQKRTPPVLPSMPQFARATTSAGATWLEQHVGPGPATG